MKTNRSVLTISVLIAVAALLVLAASPAGAQDVKARMAARLAVIDDLKARGVVGENSQGYLEFVAAPEKQDVVAAENADRGEVYAAIARQTGTSAEVVGQRRAMQIAQQSRSGVRLQQADGTWYTK